MRKLIVGVAVAGLVLVVGSAGMAFGNSSASDLPPTWHVHDGQTALGLAQERSPDLVLADVMMPNMDGFELTRRLRQDPRTAAVRRGWPRHPVWRRGSRASLGGRARGGGRHGLLLRLRLHRRFFDERRARPA